MLNFISEKVLINESYGWLKIEKNNLILWFKGYLIDSNAQNLHFEVVNILKENAFQLNILSKLSKKLNGHFAFILISSNSIFASVDKVNTIPLFYSANADNFFLSNKASLIRNKNPNDKINHQASLEIAMSGYTIGRKTLYKDLFQLTSGECIFFDKNAYEIDIYYTYSPWKVIHRKKSELKKDFNSILNLTMEELVDSINGRQVIVPLSAGYDSRLVASGLKHFGVDNVFCISYGRKGNFESKMASLIANKLGYKFKHIDINDNRKKIFFKSTIYKDYVDYFDSYSSIPAVQDIAEICYIKEKKLISDDAIIINGNSGDFISGAHLFKPKSLNKTLDNNWQKFLLKHFALWGKLNTPHNHSLIEEQLVKMSKSRKIIDFLENGDSPLFFEALEYLGRQSMYVVNQQEAYDFNQYDWRLPLWSDNFLNFWEGVPYDYKLGQKLYSEVLFENNWGGVWKAIPVNKKTIHPNWIVPLRFMSKLFLAPLGKSYWHSFERNVFEYWMDVTRNSVMTPYHKVLFDRNGQRNTISWISKEYLKQKNIII